MSEAKNGNQVKVHYTGKLKDGSVFDSSEGRDPLEFTMGAGQMIPGFEKAVMGMKVGDKVTTDIPCQEAYGEHSEQMVISVEKSNIPNEIKPEVGLQLSIQQQDGSSVPVVVTEVNENDIKLDGNHPLAGKDLIFDIELVSVK
jgi:peptidylprolyl isomerase